MADEQKEAEFKVIDRRPFTAEGELRKEVVAEQEREDEREAKAQIAKEARQAANNAAASGANLDAPAAAVPARGNTKEE